MLPYIHNFAIALSVAFGSMDIFFIIFAIGVLIMSVVIHEVSHGYAAYFQGDKTAQYQGRLTLNPLKHLDPVGSIIVPFILFLLPGNLLFGWAKPVPYNPYNLRNQKWGELIVALAGPVSNIIIALLFGLFIRFFIVGGLIANLSGPALEIMSYVVLINLVLALFNMVPIPPLDGSKVLFAFLPFKYQHIRAQLEQYGFILLIVVIFVFPEIISGVVFTLFSFLTGLGGGVF